MDGPFQVRKRLDTGGNMRTAASSLRRRIARRGVVGQTLIITAALLVMASMGLGSALAARSLISSHDIKNGSIRNVDLAGGAVNGRVIKNGSVSSSELTAALRSQMAAGKQAPKARRAIPARRGRRATAARRVPRATPARRARRATQATPAHKVHLARPRS
jgi:hypothetical protein